MKSIGSTRMATSVGVLGAALSLLAAMSPAQAEQNAEALVNATSILPEGMTGPPASSRHALNNARFYYVQGTPNDSGGCDIQAPALKFDVDEVAVQQDELGYDPQTCNSLWQEGTPVALPAGDAGLVESSEPVADETQSTTVAGMRLRQSIDVMSASSVGGGHYRSWLEDVAGLTVTYDQTSLSWSWSGGCVQSSSAGIQRGYSGNSGWEPPYNKDSGWHIRDCISHTAWSQADFKNTGFCWPNTVYSHYRDVWIQGYWNGSLSGGRGENSHSGNGYCAPLYGHNQLYRDS